MWIVSFSFCFPLEKQAVSVGWGGVVRSGCFPLPVHSLISFPLTLLTPPPLSPVPEDLSLEEREELLDIRRRKKELIDDIEVKQQQSVQFEFLRNTE